MSKFPEYNTKNHKSGSTEPSMQFLQVFTATSVLLKACSCQSQNGL